MHIIFHNDNLARNFLYAYNFFPYDKLCRHFIRMTFSLTISYGRNFFSDDELCA
jgi:hypothetical protein